MRRLTLPNILATVRISEAALSYCFPWYLLVYAVTKSVENMSDLSKLKQCIVSVLGSAKFGYTVDELNEKYRELWESEINAKTYGFNNLKEILESDELKDSIYWKGERCFAVTNANIAHIINLIAETKSKIPYRGDHKVRRKNTNYDGNSIENHHHIQKKREFTNTVEKEYGTSSTSHYSNFDSHILSNQLGSQHESVDPSVISSMVQPFFKELSKKSRDKFQDHSTKSFAYLTPVEEQNSSFRRPISSEEQFSSKNIEKGSKKIISLIDNEGGSITLSKLKRIYFERFKKELNADELRILLGFSKNDNISELELLSKCLLGYGKVKSSSGDFTLSTADLKANEDGDFIEEFQYFSPFDKNENSSSSSKEMKKFNSKEILKAIENASSNIQQFSNLKCKLNLEVIDLIIELVQTRPVSQKELFDHLTAHGVVVNDRPNFFLTLILEHRNTFRLFFSCGDIIISLVADRSPVDESPEIFQLVPRNRVRSDVLLPYFFEKTSIFDLPIILVNLELIDAPINQYRFKISFSVKDDSFVERKRFQVAIYEFYAINVDNASLQVKDFSFCEDYVYLEQFTCSAFRVRIIEKKDESLHVLLIDFSTEKRIRGVQLRKLVPKFANVPAFSVTVFSTPILFSKGNKNQFNRTFSEVCNIFMTPNAEIFVSVDCNSSSDSYKLKRLLCRKPQTIAIPHYFIEKNFIELCDRSL